MSQLSERVEALRAPLRFAAEDGFAGIDKIRDLGPTLRAACDRLVKVAPPERQGPLITWRKRLARFERLDLDEQIILGSPDAPYLIAEMFDYACHHCRRLHGHVKKAQQRYGDQHPGKPVVFNGFIFVPALTG